MKKRIENRPATHPTSDAEARAILKLAQIHGESMEATRDINTGGGAAATDILDVCDILSDARQIANLVMMAIESVVLDNELRSINTGVYRVLNQIENAETALAKIGGSMRPPLASPDPRQFAEHHARELAKAMAAMPEMMRFQITIVPHDAYQQLVWVPMTDPAQEVENLQACMDTHRLALERVAAVADPADAPEDETQTADDAEAAAFSELLKFPCQTAAAKARKTEYLVKHLGKNRLSLELGVDQLETLLESMI